MMPAGWYQKATKRIVAFDASGVTVFN